MKLNTHQEIERFTRDLYLQHFLKAVHDVGKEYCIWPFGIHEQMAERVFCYELYHQWRNYIDNDAESYCSLILNGEIIKSKSVLRKSITLATPKIPDFVLHEAQNNMNSQKLICEVKTMNLANISTVLTDIRKLDNFVSELGFQHAAFIQVYSNDENKFRIVESVVANNSFNNTDKIIYIVKSHDSISCKYLSECE